MTQPTQPERIPYDKLNAQDKAAVKTWVAAHGIDERNLPDDATIDYDPVADEWVITLLRIHDGATFIDKATGKTAVGERRTRRRPEQPAPVALEPVPVDGTVDRG